MTYRAINNIVKSILERLEITTIPIKVDEVAKHRGVAVVPYQFENEISGILIVESGGSTIGYNCNESLVRQRFTIAHELGHYELHKDLNPVFYDKSFKVMFRASGTKGEEANRDLEREANAFAAALLMPEDFVKREIVDKEFDLDNEDSIRKLAKNFNVSTSAMYYRMANLGIIQI